MKVLTFSFEPEKEKVKVVCTMGDKVVAKYIGKDSKPLRMAAALDDHWELADIEVVTAQ